VSGPRARMFLALDLPEDARDDLVRWRDAILASRADVRPVRAEALHVTLVFLGWQDESAADRIAGAAFDAVPDGPQPRLAAKVVKPVPPRNARLFALDLHDDGGRATALQAGMSAALEAGGWYRPEKRPFWPHITLARVKRGERRVPPPPEDPAPPAAPFDAGLVTLYRSTLRPQGALYEPLARTVAGDALDPASGPAAD
jgi:RNA 2',3'-cyclic 3'-phosphodiesterase